MHFIYRKNCSIHKSNSFIDGMQYIKLIQTFFMSKLIYNASGNVAIRFVEQTHKSSVLQYIIAYI